MRALPEVDPVSAAAIHENNVRRVQRALEIFYLTGRPKSEWDRESLGRPPAVDLYVIGLAYHHRDLLYARIDRRVDEMLSAGLLDEARRLYVSGALEKNRTAAGAIGYKELVPVFSGACTLEEAARTLKTATRRYAKRQMTWFGAKKYVHPLFCDTPSGRMRDFEDIFADCRAMLRQNRILKRGEYVSGETEWQEGGNNSRGARFLLALLKILLVIGLVVYILYHLTNGFSSELRTVSATLSEERVTLELTGTVVRAETVIESGTGAVSYHFQDGERVKTGARVAVLYSGYADSASVEKLAELDRAIARLEASDLGSDVTVADGVAAESEAMQLLLSVSESAAAESFMKLWRRPRRFFRRFRAETQDSLGRRGDNCAACGAESRAGACGRVAFPVGAP